jgi:hypothetical protein
MLYPIWQKRDKKVLENNQLNQIMAESRAGNAFLKKKQK